MIAYFPTIYPDELVYSLLARYYTKSGYLAYTFAAQDLFTSKTVKPDIEFLNTYNPEALHMITKTKTMEEIVMNHTMFPYYGRFITHERRKKAFDSLVSMSGEYHTLLPLPKSKTKEIRYLRYCPICAAQDREYYGETYWHRVHQLIGVNICPIHHCYLVESTIPICSAGSPSLITAEEVVDASIKNSISDNPLECKLTEYIAEVFQYSVDLPSSILVGQFLNSKLEYTKYLSQRGDQRNMSLLHSDFTEYYKTLPDNPLSQQWQLGKVFSNARHSTYEICMVAMFLDIQPANLVKMSLPEKSQQQRFDDMIFELHNQGLNYRQIADRMNAKYDTVKAIGEGLYGTYHYYSSPKQVGSKKKDWEQIDKDRLPAVKDAILKLWGNEMERPQKITVGIIERYLGLPKKGLKNCPLCLAEIKNHYETQEEYWAREIEWAIKVLITKNIPINMTSINKIINVNNKDVITQLISSKNNSLRNSKKIY